MSERRLRAYLLLLIATTVWALAGPVIKFTLSEISPFNFLFYRFGISSLISLGLLTKGKIRLPKKRQNLWLLFWCGMFGNAIALGLLFVGLDMTTVLDASIIESTIPLVVAAMGVRLMNDRITRREKIGTAIALMGTIITIIGPLLGDGGTVRVGYLERFTGNALILLFVMADSYSFILAKRLTRRRVKPEVITNFSFVIGLGAMVPMVLVTGGVGKLWGEISEMSLSHHVGVWYMAMLSGTLAYWLWTKGQKTIEVSEAALFRYLIPILAAPVAILWLKEELTVHFVLGAAVIARGVIIAEYKRREKGKRNA